MTEFEEACLRTALEANQNGQHATLAHVYVHALRASSARKTDAVQQAVRRISQEVIDGDQRMPLQNAVHNRVVAWFDPKNAAESFRRFQSGRSDHRLRFADELLEWLLEGDFTDPTQDDCRKICREAGVMDAVQELAKSQWFESADDGWLATVRVPLVGRDADLQEHLAHLTSAVRTRRHYLLLGPASAGKTVFVHELMAQARSRWRATGDRMLQQQEFVYVPKVLVPERQAFEQFQELDRYLQAHPHAIPVFDGFEIFLADNLPLRRVFLELFGGVLQGSGRTFVFVAEQESAERCPWLRHLRGWTLPGLAAGPVRQIALRRLNELLAHAGEMLALADSLQPDALVDEMLRLAQDYYPHRTLLDVVLSLIDGLVALATARQDQQQPQPVAIGVEDLRQYVARQQGLSVEVIGLDPDVFYRRAAERIKQQVVGQDHAVDLICRILTLRARSPARRLPRARCLFVGPPGVGKTELARVLAEQLGYGRDGFLKYNMADFANDGDRWRFIGAPAGYKGFSETRTLFDEVRQRPSCVILLDEVDRAHVTIQDILLSILEGEAKDGRNQLVSFSQVIVLMTTNLGQELVENLYERAQQEDCPRNRLAESYNESLADLIDRAPADGPAADVLRDLVLRGAVDEAEAALLVRLDRQLDELKRTLSNRLNEDSDGFQPAEYARDYLHLRGLRDAMEKQVRRSAFDRAFMDRIDFVIPFFPIKEPELLERILHIKLQQAGWIDCPAEICKDMIARSRRERESVRALERLVQQAQVQQQ